MIHSLDSCLRIASLIFYEIANYNSFGFSRNCKSRTVYFAEISVYGLVKFIANDEILHYGLNLCFISSLEDILGQGTVA